MSGRKPPELRLVRGGRAEARVGAVRVSMAPPDSFPPVAALVLEEDTWLILSADTAVTEPAEHLVRLLTELQATEPLAPGRVILRAGRPLKFLAVVHDFSSEPCCRPAWISAALTEILSICGERQIPSLLLPLFGVRHGGLKPAAVVPLIIRAIRAEAAASLKTVVLAVPPGDREEVERILSAGADRGEAGGIGT
jgi:O-acetyl-ADP-ribose deacetylase (regulator of RNase III)